MSSPTRILRDGGVFRAGPWIGDPPVGSWPSVFSVYASDDPAAPALLGRHAFDGEWLTFTPRFKPASGVALRAEFRPSGQAPVQARFADLPVPARAPSTRVVSLTPSASVWPENVLKVYVTFSAPMRMGVSWAHIRLLDEAGAAVPAPFVEIDQELWDPQGRRLTVLFDPARIKRGLVDHAAEGLPLVPGRRYTLEVDAAWHDAAGAPMAETFRKSIAVAPAQRDSIDIAAWRVTAPASPTAPLTVDFDRPLDAALALRAISVVRNGAPIAGVARLEAEETRLIFTPAAPWRPGPYQLAVSPILEDLAGNRPGRPFDIDRAAPGQPAPDALAATLSFVVS